MPRTSISCLNLICSITSLYAPLCVQALKIRCSELERVQEECNALKDQYADTKTELELVGRVRHTTHMPATNEMQAWSSCLPANDMQASHACGMCTVIHGCGCSMQAAEM